MEGRRLRELAAHGSSTVVLYVNFPASIKFPLFFMAVLMLCDYILVF